MFKVGNGLSVAGGFVGCAGAGGAGRAGGVWAAAGKVSNIAKTIETTRMSIPANSREA
jgi:hypothetical protein